MQTRCAGDVRFFKCSTRVQIVDARLLFLAGWPAGVRIRTRQEQLLVRGSPAVRVWSARTMAAHFICALMGWWEEKGGGGGHQWRRRWRGEEGDGRGCGGDRRET